jgi:hypothetical protein
MPVPVDVIRVSFWMEVFMKVFDPAYESCRVNINPWRRQEKIQNFDTNDRNFSRQLQD